MISKVTVGSIRWISTTPVAAFCCVIKVAASKHSRKIQNYLHQILPIIIKNDVQIMGMRKQFISHPNISFMSTMSIMHYICFSHNTRLMQIAGGSNVTQNYCGGELSLLCLSDDMCRPISGAVAWCAAESQQMLSSSTGAHKLRNIQSDCWIMRLRPHLI
jgi:hypothetical protein